jgi:hypothetical protein
MAAVVYNIDTIITVFDTASVNLIGSRSVYSEIPHPATNKKIEGWKWDQRIWPSKSEIEAAAIAPTLWDPDVSGVENDQYQSGIGDNNDLLLLDVNEVTLSGTHHWAPIINHGYFYVENEEWYLYSDEYITQYFTEASVSGTHQVLDLQEFPKPTIPLQVRRYRFDGATGRYQVNLDARRRVEFSVSGTQPEYILDTTFSPPRVELNGIWTEQIGVPVVVPADLLELEIVGVSNGNPYQEFQTEFYPIDRSQPVEVWLYSSVSGTIDQYTVLSGLQDFTGPYNEVYVDYDTGSIRFGDFHISSNPTGKGHIPPIGRKVAVYYTAGLSACYEPERASNAFTALNAKANVNPVYSSISTGFVQIGTELIEPASITLTANLPKINPYLIDLGNNVGTLIAEVKTKNGIPVEGQEVFFEILSPQIGTFGLSSTEISAITRAGGIAQTLFNSPRTALDAGQPTIEVNYSGPDTIIYVDGITDPGDVTRLFTYKIHKEDEVLGIPDTSLASYYTNYFAEEDIVSGVQATQAFEEDHRVINELPTPLTYTSTELAVGKKSILLTTKSGSSNVVDPNTGTEDEFEGGLTVLSPLFPSTITDESTTTSPRLKLTFEGVTLEEPGVGDTKAYFIIGDSQTRIRAYTISNRTNQKIYSNTIQMKITIPDSLTGSYFVDDLNELPTNVINTLLKRPRNIAALTDGEINQTSGVSTFYQDYLDERLYTTASGNETYANWFIRTRRADSAGLLLADQTISSELGPENITLSGFSNAEIPLGFRLKSTGITVASILDQVTFITPNDILPSGYFDIE